MKDLLCRLFTPWKSGDQFDSADAFFGFLLARNKALNVLRAILFGVAFVLLVLGYAVSDMTNGYSIADLANQPYYLIAVVVLLLSLGVSLVIMQNENELPPDMRKK